MIFDTHQNRNIWAFSLTMFQRNSIHLDLEIIPIIGLIRHASLFCLRAFACIADGI